MFIIPCLSLTRRERSCCLEKSKRRRGKREKSPDQGAVVTMATVSAPVSLKLGEGVGLLHPSVPPTLLPSSHPKPTALSSALWKRPLGTESSSFVRGPVPAPPQLEGSPQEVSRGACACSRAPAPTEPAPVHSGLCLAADGLYFTLGEPSLWSGLASIASEVGVMAEHR